MLQFSGANVSPNPKTQFSETTSEGGFRLKQDQCGFVLGFVWKPETQTMGVSPPLLPAGDVNVELI